MAWRTLFLSTPCNLRSAHGQLEHTSLDKNGKNTIRTFPFEDISVVVADTNQISLTNAVLAQFAEHGILYVVCDAKHTPSGIFTPYNAHSKVSAVSYAHMQASKPLAKRVWQIIIKQKISNQAKVLALSGRNSRKLSILIDKVQSGDSTNVESQAAALYFTELFNSDFRRSYDNFVNSCLDYGYAIVRSAVARNITASGLIPWLGVWHKNMLNAFNLADDLVEPFRPFVDYWVLNKIDDLFSNPRRKLDTKHKTILVQCLDMQCGINTESGTEQMALLFASGRVTATLAKTFQQKDASLLHLPYILPKEL